MREMISYPGKAANFNCRVAGVAFDPSGERVLIHRGPTDPFWTLPGGRVELMEPAAQALKREMKEELSVDIQVERILWVVENFFEYNGASWHEIAFYFLLTLPPACPLFAHRDPFAGYEEGSELIYQWHDLGTISQVNLVPSFLRTALTALPPSVEHIVHIDE